MCVLHGQVYHRISVLLPSGNKDPSYGQMYIYDPVDAADRRVKLDPGLEKRLCEKIHRMLLRCENPYVASCKHMYEKMQSHEQGDDAQVVLRFRSGDTPDPRRYNEPSGRDVAAVFAGDKPPSRREISVYSRSSQETGDTHGVSYLNEHVDPMTYPLLFPNGDTCWCPELQVAGKTDQPPTYAPTILGIATSTCKH